MNSLNDKIRIRNAWRDIENRHARDRRHSRTLLLIKLAKEHPHLKTYYPATSHETLCFSTKTTFPFSNDYLYVEPILTCNDISVLTWLKHKSIVQRDDYQKIAASSFQSHYSKYPTLFEVEQYFFEVSKQNTITRVLNPEKAVDFFLNTARDKFGVYVRKNNQTKSNLLFIGKATEAIKIASQTIKTILA